MAIMPYKDALARFDAVEVSMIEDAVNKFGDGAGGVDRNTFIRCCLTVLPDKIQHVKRSPPLTVPLTPPVLTSASHFESRLNASASLASCACRS